jgi:hypothetical protein
MPALLHPAERRLGHRDLEAVDADHAGLDALAEQVHAARIVREAERGEPVRQPVRLADHRVEVVEWIQQRDRAERLLVHDARRVRHVGEHRGLEKEAAALQAPAAREQPRAVRDGVVDQRLQRRRPPRVRQRSHAIRLVERISDGQCGRARREPFGEPRVDGAVHVEPRRRHAHLPGVAILGRDAGVEHLPDVHVLAHDHRRVPAQLHRRALHAVRRELHELFAHRDRPGERHLADHG